MELNQPETNVARATAAWGKDMPRWVRLLAGACDASSQRIVAERIEASGFRCSSATISRLINRKYPASYQEYEQAVLAVYSGDGVECPIFGPIPLSSCIRNRRRKAPPINYAHHQYAANCPTCRNNTDTDTDKGLDDDGDAQ